MKGVCGLLPTLWLLPMPALAGQDGATPAETPVVRCESDEGTRQRCAMDVSRGVHRQEGQLVIALDVGRVLAIG